MNSVLLLNSSFEPLKVISWQRAVGLFFSGKVEVLEEYDHPIRSVSIVIKAPAVVRLLQFVKIGQKTPPLSRVNVLARDGFICQYCNKRLTSKNATLDHILPKSMGGRTEWTNMVCCCKSCNNYKGCRTPEQAGMKLKRIPQRPDWLPVIRFKLESHVPGSWNLFVRHVSSKK